MARFAAAIIVGTTIATITGGLGRSLENRWERLRKNSVDVLLDFGREFVSEMLA
jgi:hypothetical protein